jgi:hypothetical protein
MWLRTDGLHVRLACIVDEYDWIITPSYLDNKGLELFLMESGTKYRVKQIIATCIR